MKLPELLAESPRSESDHPAVEDPARDATITYGQLQTAAAHVRDTLLACGVREGDRVGICCPKSIGAVASIFGIMQAGAAYVPVDPTAPAGRSAGILSDCSVRAVVAATSLVDGLAEVLGTSEPQSARRLEELDRYGTELVVLEGPAAGADRPGAEQTVGDLAYVLYTSGSTGKPKGVMHSHASALSFIDWCSETFDPRPEDRFSSHAPFHFDLSIHDLYVSIKHGGTIVLVEEELGKIPQRLAKLIHDEKISIWYSTPSVLRTLVEYGELGRVDWPTLRIVLFAGEVFPVKYFRRLKEAWPEPGYFNLYGPTETNVCTYYEVPNVFPDDRTDPFPIGKTCSNDRARVVDAECGEVSPGEQGELLVAGGSVMSGYWNLATQTAESFVADGDGTRWYRTGDIVRENSEGDYEFIGRRDRMIKRRGYRVELGEIEAALYSHPSVTEAAAVALTDPDGDLTVKAFIYCAEEETPSQIEIKSWCVTRLPLYMIPDRISFRDEPLAKTSTDKVDYEALKALD